VNAEVARTAASKNWDPQTATSGARANGGRVSVGSQLLRARKRQRRHGPTGPTTAFATACSESAPPLPERQGSAPSQDPHPQDDEARADEAPQPSTRPRRFVFGGGSALPPVPECPGPSADQPERGGRRGEQWRRWVLGRFVGAVQRTTCLLGGPGRAPDVDDLAAPSAPGIGPSFRREGKAAGRAGQQHGPSSLCDRGSSGMACPTSEAVGLLGTRVGSALGVGDVKGVPLDLHEEIEDIREEGETSRQQHRASGHSA
jgi:hypothetical protein